MICAFSWFAFDDETRDSSRRSSAARCSCSGCWRSSLLYALIRSAGRGHADRLVVVNGYRRHEYEWAEIIAVRLPRARPG